MAEAQGAVNVYTCQSCGARLVTKNRDEGTTPFMVGCQRDGCGGVCYSGFYRVDQSLVPTHEWFRPVSAGERRHLANPDVAEHVKMGGLLLRDLATGRVGD